MLAGSAAIRGDVPTGNVETNLDTAGRTAGATLYFGLAPVARMLS
jgi:hypothetical protein